MSPSAPIMPFAPPPRRWWQRLSLRARLLTVVTALLVIALLATGVLTLTVLKPVLVDQKDRQLRDALSDPQSLQDLLARRGSSDGPEGPSQFYVELADADGRVLRVDVPGQPGDSPPDLGPLTTAEAERRQDRPYDAVSADRSMTWRALTVPGRLQSTGEPVTVTVALPLDDVTATVAQLGARLIVLGLLVTAACVLVGWLAVRRAFRPLLDVEDVTAAFAGGDTSRRVTDDWPGTEVGRLGGSVNGMLDQIETTLAAREASEAKMRRFVGDASHELRTPLAAVRGFAELYRMGAVSTPDDVAHAFRRIEGESTRMGGLVEDLLVLARMDAQRPLQHRAVDLLVLAADAVHDALALAPDRQVTLTGLDGTGEASPAPTTGDEPTLRQVVTNLMANAIRHTPSGTPISLEVGRRSVDGQQLAVVLRVVDHGPGVPREQADQIFERFFRADASRTRSAGGGSGLGLAIVAAIVDAHGGQARVLPTPGGGATFEVALPVRAQEGHPSSPQYGGVLA